MKRRNLAFAALRLKMELLLLMAKQSIKTAQTAQLPIQRNISLKILTLIGKMR
jgi:hypothetical protein